MGACAFLDETKRDRLASAESDLAERARSDGGPDLETSAQTRASRASSDRGLVFQLPFFYNLDHKNRQLIRSLFVRQKFPKGSRLFSQGESKLGLLVVVSGTVGLWVDRKGQVAATDGKDKKSNTGAAAASSELVLLAKKEKGQYFGDFALIDKAGFAPVTATALTDTVILLSSAEEFKKAVKENPGLSVHILSASGGVKSRPVRVRLNEIPLFSGIPELRLHQLASLTDFENFSAGQVVCRQGAVADGLYFIVRGRVTIMYERPAEKIFLCVLREGDWFGEIALVKTTHRTATVTAQQNCSLLFISRESFSRFVSIFPSLRQSAYFEDLIRKRTAASLKAIPLFAPLVTKQVGPMQRFDDSKLSILGDLFRYTQVPKDGFVFREGDQADAFFIVIVGKLVVKAKGLPSVTVEDDDKALDGTKPGARTHASGDAGLVLATLGPNDWFGETALAHDTRRTASVVAATDCILLKLEKKNFSAFLRLVPGSQSRLEHRLTCRTAARLRLIPFFAEVSENRPWSKLDILAALFRFEEYKHSAEIIKQGDRGDKFFFIVDGKVEAVATTSRGEKTQLSYMGTHDWFGEIALLRDTTRTATIRVVSEPNCLLLSLNRQNFSKFCLVAPELRAHFVSLLEQRTAQSLKNLKPFSAVRENRNFSKLEMIASLTEHRQFNDKQVVVRRGHTVDRFYVLLRGRVAVTNLPVSDAKTDPLKGVDTKVATASKVDEAKAAEITQTVGYFFGHEELLGTDEKSRQSSHSYRSVGQSVYLTLSRVAFQRMCEVAPEILPTFGHEHAVHSRFHRRLMTADFSDSSGHPRQQRAQTGSTARTDPSPRASTRRSDAEQQYDGKSGLQQVDPVSALGSKATSPPMSRSQTIDASNATERNQDENASIPFL